MVSKASIHYKASVEKDLRRIGKPNAPKIMNKLEKDLSNNPDQGIPLKGEFGGLFKYRIGDYRIIYAKIPDGVLVLRIAHRKEVYH